MEIASNIRINITNDVLYDQRVILCINALTRLYFARE